MNLKENKQVGNKHLLKVQKHQNNKKKVKTSK